MSRRIYLWAAAVVLHGAFAMPARGGDKERDMHLKWTTPLDDFTPASMAAAGESVFYGLKELDARTGKLRRQFSADGAEKEIRAILFSAGVVVFASQGDHPEEAGPGEERHTACAWSAFDLRTGKPLWRTKAEFTDSRPALQAVSSESVFVVRGSRADQLSALEPRTGKTRWVNDAFRVTDLAAEGNLVVLQTESAVAALAAATGQLLWQKPLRGVRREPLSIDSKRIYVVRESSAPEGGILSVLSRETGQVLWEKEIAREGFLTPTASSETVFVCAYPSLSDNTDRVSHLRALSALDGKEMWAREVVTDWNGHEFQPVLQSQSVLMWAGDPHYFEKWKSSGTIRLWRLNAATGTLEAEYRPPAIEKPIYLRAIPWGDEILFSDSQNVYRTRNLPRRQ